MKHNNNQQHKLNSATVPGVLEAISLCHSYVGTEISLIDLCALAAACAIYAARFDKSAAGREYTAGLISCRLVDL